jgi:hypothetical protein
MWLRVAACSGFAMTMLFCMLAIFPIIQVTSWFSFGAKIAGVAVGANLLGAALYWFEQRRQKG